jgi:hypothetical protein
LQNNGSDDEAVAGVYFEFATALNDGSNYNVTVLTQPVGQSCSVINGSGTLVGANVTDVTLSCKGWGSTELIESDDTNDAVSPDIAADSDGNAIAVWRQTEGTRFSIYANRYVVGTGWGSAELIETNQDGNAYSPKIAFDSSGNALAVWQQSDGNRPNIWANRYVAGSGWGTAELIETTNTGGAYGPKIAVDDSGNALAVWHQSNGSYYSIWANRYTAGSGWGTAELIENDDAGNAYRPEIALDASGNALAVWSQNDGVRNNIMANRYVAGSGWGTAELIESDDSGGASSPDIAIDSDGNALAVWTQWDGSTQPLWANRYVPGTGWGTAEQIDSSGGDAYSQQIAFDADGNALVVWYQDTGSVSNILANRYAVGAGWGSYELIETDDAGHAADPQLAIDGNGKAMVVWQQSDGSVDHIWANRFE